METTTAVELRESKEGLKFKVSTNLIGREEEFRMLALAHATGLPLLLLGLPGIGKTQLINEYAKGFLGAGAKVFVIELDPFMRSSEIKGRPNMAALVDKESPRYEVMCPIKDVDIIMLNEIDKASGEMRNSLLSVMAEHKIFTGLETIDLAYQCLVASCNEIPKEEKGNPFWDRFILRRTATRMTQEQIMKYYSSGGKEHREEIEIRLPSEDDIRKSSKLSTQKVLKLVQACYNTCSDRTISFLPAIVKAIAFIWKCSMDKAMIKAVEILVTATAAKTFSDQIISKDLQNVTSRLDMIPGISNVESLRAHVDEIRIIVKNGCKSGKFNEEQALEIEELLNNALFEKGVDPEIFNKK